MSQFAGATLAHELDAPILLTESKYITPDIKKELLRLNPERIIILGGKAVVSEEIESHLKQTYEVNRIAGWDQYGKSSSPSGKISPMLCRSLPGQPITRSLFY